LKTSFFLALLFAGLATALSAQTIKTVHSPSRRFVIVGTNTTQLIPISRWSDEVAEKAERILRIKMDFREREFRIVVDAGDRYQSGRVQHIAGFSKGIFVQKLLIENPEAIDWEEVLEVFCSLLLDGQTVAQAKSSRPEVRRVPAVPAWFSTGLAHNLDPALKSRDRRIVMNWGRAGALPPFSSVVKWHVLPDGRSMEKAISTAAVEWLLSLPDSAKCIEMLFSRLASGDAVSAEWIATLFPDCRTVEVLDGIWQARLDGERLVIADTGASSALAVEMLKDQLAIRALELGIPVDTNMSMVIEMKDLVAMKEKDWLPAFCVTKATQIRLSAGAGSPELLDAVEKYCVFLEALKNRRHDAKLLALLAEADAARQRLETVVMDRKKYVDEIEARHEGREPGVKAGKVPLDELERSEIQRYIDRVEKQVSGADNTGANRIPVGGLEDK